jgi:hypothetical protein
VNTDANTRNHTAVLLAIGVAAGMVALFTHWHVRLWLAIVVIGLVAGFIADRRR